MTQHAIEVRDVTKRFRLHKERHKSIKERLLHPRSGAYTDVTALHEVAFTVEPGQTVGIIGHNGSGKSTLLKTICGVLQPTTGEVLVRGKLAGLLELGAGFEPELSGRDNIYLNGSMLGIPKVELDRVFDDIVAFSELGAFIDHQVKFYSSGMYVRLGFAVAVNVDPDVLVVDEVLAVGDERFQRKCLDRIGQFQDEGRTILFVSQAAEQVRAVCDRVLVLHHGELVFDGEPGAGIRLFRERLNEVDAAVGAVVESSELTSPDPSAPAVVEAAPATRAAGARSITIDQVTWACPGVVGAVPTGGEVHVCIDLTTSHAIDDVVVTLELLQRGGGEVMVRTDTDVLGISVDLVEGPQRFTFYLESLPFLDGDYPVNVGVQSRHGREDAFAWAEEATTIQVTYAGRGRGMVELAMRADLDVSGAR